MLLILGIVAVLIYYTGLFRLVRSYIYRKRLTSLIPGDEGIPILGHLFQLGRTSETMPKILLELAKKCRNNGSNLLKMYILHETAFVPLNGQMLKFILDSNDEITKGNDYDIFEPWLGRGLLLSTGDKWRSRRKMLTPSFHFSMLSEYVVTMNRHAKVLVEILHDMCEREFDVFPFTKRSTLDIISGPLFIIIFY